MIIRKLTYVLFILLFFANIPAQSIFNYQNPSYTPESINSIHFNNQTGFVVGNYGLILRTTNQGQSFIQQYSSSQANYKKIFIVDPLVSYALDDSLRLFKTTNVGINWVLNSSFNNPVNDIYYNNQNTGFITTSYNIGMTYNNGLNWTYVSPDNSSPYKFLDICFINSQTGYVSALNLTSNYSYLFKTTNNGLNWNWYNTTVDAFEINNIYFINAQTGWCAGSRFENLYVMKTINGGVNWFESPSSFNSFSPNNLYFANDSTGYITSLSKVLKTTNGGSNWFTLLTGSGFQSSYFINESTFYLADLYSRIFKSYNAGITFDTLLGKQNTLLNKIQSITPDNLWCNGLNNANWKSTNGGANWIYDYTSSLLKIKYTLFVDINTGFAIANRGTVLKTTNFGLNWSTVHEYSSEIYSLYFLNSQTGWAFADNVIIRTSNSGSDWAATSNPDAITKANFFDDQYGIGYNGNYLFKTNNGGINWSLNTIGFVSDYFFLNSSTGWTVLNVDSVTLIQKTTNSGNNWNQISVINSNINSVRFLNQSTGYLLSFSRLYRTTDSGYSWKFVNIPTALRIFAMDLKDVNTGWICGDNSVIIKLNNGSSIFINNETKELSDFILYQNYPNPFNSETNIKFKISDVTNAALKIYDIQGREVIVLINRILTPNTYDVRLNSSALSSGIYFYVLKTDNKSITKKLVVLK